MYIIQEILLDIIVIDEVVPYAFERLCRQVSHSRSHDFVILRRSLAALMFIIIIVVSSLL